MVTSKCFLYDTIPCLCCATIHHEDTCTDLQRQRLCKRLSFIVFWLPWHIVWTPQGQLVAWVWIWAWTGSGITCKLLSTEASLKTGWSKYYPYQSPHSVSPTKNFDWHSALYALRTSHSIYLPHFLFCCLLLFSCCETTWPVGTLYFPL